MTDETQKLNDTDTKEILETKNQDFFQYHFLDWNQMFFSTESKTFTVDTRWNPIP